MQSGCAVDGAHQLSGACCFGEIFSAGVAGLDAVDIVLRGFELQAFN
jgi:hypothetical protein